MVLLDLSWLEWKQHGPAIFRSLEHRRLHTGSVLESHLGELRAGLLLRETAATNERCETKNAEASDQT